jgi:hypothetical protein
MGGLVDGNVGFNCFYQWNRSLWSQSQYIETKFQFGNYVCWFPRAISTHALKF